MQQLVDSVNRKYSLLFGNNLVEVKRPHAMGPTDSSKLDTADFMKVLKSGSIKQFTGIRPNKKSSEKKRRQTTPSSHDKSGSRRASPEYQNSSIFDMDR